jgi:hypothetical protein
VPAAGTLTALSPLRVAWFKNSDDQGTNFDVRAEITSNGVVVVAAQALCLTGITRNPRMPWRPPSRLAPLIRRPSTGPPMDSRSRSSPGSDQPRWDQMCGHNNAVGLRFYFDAATPRVKLGARSRAHNRCPPRWLPIR